MDPWSLPVAGLQVYKHREEIRGIWARLTNRLRGQRAIVAVTGPPGVGKTVIFDHLTGEAAKESYQPPGKSRLIERGIRRAKGLRVLLRVIPGQEDSPIRVQGLGDLFNAKQPVAGLLHVVANGYSDVRSDFAKSQLQTQLSLDQFRQAQLEGEIDDLKSTLHYVRGAMPRYQGPFWIVVAVNKADLFASEDALRAAQTHYTGPGSAFVAAMDEFASQIGRDNVQWEALPVSAWPETFVWGNESVAPTLDRGQQLQTIVRLAKALEQFSGTAHS